MATVDHAAVNTGIQVPLDPIFWEGLVLNRAIKVVLTKKLRVDLRVERGSRKNLPGDMGRGTGQSQGRELEGAQEHQEKRRPGGRGGRPLEGRQGGNSAGSGGMTHRPPF